jgi:hypothetical protein
MALNDPYGTGLMDNTRENLIAAGLAEDSIQTLTYDPQAANYDAEIQQMVDFNPNASRGHRLRGVGTDHRGPQLAGHRPGALIPAGAVPGA